MTNESCRTVDDLVLFRVRFGNTDDPKVLGIKKNNSKCSIQAD